VIVAGTEKREMEFFCVRARVTKLNKIDDDVVVVVNEDF